MHDGTKQVFPYFEADLKHLKNFQLLIRCVLCTANVDDDWR